MESLRRKYEWLFNDISDPRIKGWLLMDSPVPLATIFVVYVYAVKVALPRFMKDRKAYSLKTLLRWYNIFQIITNGTLFYGILTSGWLTTITLGCNVPTGTETDPESLSMLKWMHRTILFRIVDMIETTFFIFRKKNEQASFLHTYHHCVSPFLMWIGLKYIGGGTATLSFLINNPIHVIMYSYYLISAEASPALRAKMNKKKKYLTAIQMVQFIVLLIHGSQAFAATCPIPWAVPYFYFPNIGVIFYLFYEFYTKTYSKKRDANANIITNGSADLNARKMK